MKEIIITRNFQDENQTLGVCNIIDNGKVIFTALSLERGWMDNEKRVSCIPKGEYCVELEWSNRFKKDLWEIKGVENRSECKFHSANFWYQLNGCITLGNKLKDVNNDGYNDVLNSRDTMRMFHHHLKGLGNITLTIN